jgi:hypothetical protein
VPYLEVPELRLQVRNPSLHGWGGTWRVSEGPHPFGPDAGVHARRLVFEGHARPQLSVQWSPEPSSGHPSIGTAEPALERRCKRFRPSGPVQQAVSSGRSGRKASAYRSPPSTHGVS